MSKVGMMSVSKQITALLLVGMLVLAGCSGGEEPVKPAGEGASDDQKAIASLINGLSDLASRAVAGRNYKEFRVLFTKDASPKTSDITKFKEHSVTVDGDYSEVIAVNGSTATVPVAIMKYGTDNTSNASWTATKGDDGTWKLSSASLP